MTIRLSRLARRDLDDIQRYTIETWGRAQWFTCYRGLVGAFNDVALDPDGGSLRCVRPGPAQEPDARRSPLMAQWGRHAPAVEESVLP